MKRLIALAALLCAASACTTTENTNTGANTNNANAAATATATPAGVSQADIEAKERQVWDAIKAKNWDAFAGLLSDDFIVVGGDGVQTKAQMLEEIKKYDLKEYSFADIKFIKVDPDLAILTYTANEKSSFDGHETPSNPTRASSAWVNKGGKWVAAYHQETEAAQMTPPPAGANSNTAANTNANTNTNTNSNTSSANTNANASASPSAAEAANPIEKEKKVWEEFKAKDWAAFSTDLADEFIEVEPPGVYTKAGAIEGLKQMDASKYTLSDWKETKIDADASIVTYHVKSADGKDEGNHATIWAKRGERWWAFLHQGTPVMKK